MNKVVLIGNLTRDVESGETKSGMRFANFSLAVNRRRKADGEQETDYFNVTAWGKLGELCSQYLAKGRKAAVEGRIQTRSYEKDGQKRMAWDVIAENVEFLSPRGEAPAAPKMEDFALAYDEEMPF